VLEMMYRVATAGIKPWEKGSIQPDIMFAAEKKTKT
jgi:hypothetical protein